MEIKNIAVIGAGIMGTGIAHVCSLGEFNVCAYDINKDILRNTLITIDKNMEKGVKLGKIDARQKENALSRVKCTTDFEVAASGADMVIEAVPENMELKQNVFKQLNESCPSKTIFATNTSSMSITEIASAVDSPERVIGLHFFNPVHLMKLVEIICGLETSEETFTTCEEACRRMGKQTVKINESPGFVTTRINALIGNEAFKMLQEGLGTPEDIDTAIKLGLNHPMGPFEMVDLVGLDTRLKILEYLHMMLGESYRPVPLMIKYVKAGRLGRKTGRGVYSYNSFQKENEKESAKN